MGLKVNPDHRFDAEEVDELKELEANNPQLGNLVKCCYSIRSFILANYL